MHPKSRLNLIYQYLLMTLAFLMPLTVFGANFIIVLIVLIWLLSGDYKNKFYEISSNKFLLASIFFYLIHILGLIWTSDISWGLKILHKNSNSWGDLTWIPEENSFNNVFVKNIPIYTDVKEGDFFITSGAEGLFPRGIIIGRALSVKENIQ